MKIFKSSKGTEPQSRQALLTRSREADRELARIKRKLEETHTTRFEHLCFTIGAWISKVPLPK